MVRSQKSEAKASIFWLLTNSAVLLLRTPQNQKASKSWILSRIWLISGAAPSTALA